MPDIYAYSVDYDGCLMGRGPCLPYAANLMKRMVAILAASESNSVVMMVGSYRQSIALDARSEQANKNGSCFPVYITLLDKFRKKYQQYAHRISLDTLLLEDIHEKTASGVHFERAIQEGNFRDDQRVKCAWHDLTKCALQYVQMHHLATKFPNDTIHYYFHDDLHERILLSSHQYFTKFSYCVPHNVRHKHHHYVLGKYESQFSEIEGKGLIDSDYRQTVQSFDGDLLMPITGKIFLEEVETLRCIAILSSDRFAFFKNLINQKGHTYPPRFFDILDSDMLWRDYRGFLLHQAIAENNLQSVAALLQGGANYLLLNEKRVDALSVVVQHKKQDYIVCFAEHTKIHHTNQELMRYVSALSVHDFYQWQNELFSKQSNRSISVLLQHRLGGMSEAHALFATYFIEKKSGEFHCTKKVFQDLLDMLKSVEKSLTQVAQNLRYFRSHTTCFPGDDFQDPMLDALCYFISEHYELNNASFSIKNFHYYEFFFEMLKMTQEISKRMCLTTVSSHEKILIYYRWYVHYHAVMSGKMKEELNDLNQVANAIHQRFPHREISLNYIAGYLESRCADIPWKGVQESVKQTPKLAILESIRAQANENKENKLVYALFVSLQSLVVQTESLPTIIKLMDSWLAMQATDAVKTSVREVLEEADDEGCTCFSFFSPKNSVFLDELRQTIVETARYS